jgi:enoyl-[acyl-carrier protein] reductase II
MVSAAESPVHDNFKNFICEAAETDTLLLNRKSTPALRALRTRHSEQIDLDDGNAMAELGRILDLYFGGDMEASIALSGQVVGRIDAVVPVATILRDTVREFMATAKELGRFAAETSGA